MKALLFLASAMIISFAGYSQISKGTCMLGGDVFLSLSSISSTNSSGTTYTTSNTSSYTVVPEFGYMISNNWEIGIGLGVTGSSDKSLVGDTSLGKDFEFNIQPFVRYYHPFTEDSKFYCRATGGVNLGFGTQKGYEGSANTLEDENTTTNIGVGISPGIAWAPLKHFIFGVNYGNLGYTVMTTKYNQGGAATQQDGKGTDSGFNFDVNPSSISLGFDYTF